MSNLGQWGKKPCVTYSCLTQLPPLKTAAVSWGSYGWEWSVVGLSFLAHMHTSPAGLTSQWQETTAITGTDGTFSPRRC